MSVEEGRFTEERAEGVEQGGQQRHRSPGSTGEHGAPTERHDGIRDENSSRSPAEERRCAYSRCRAVLPEARTGRKREFCHERDRTWNVDGRTVTCAELGRAERLLAAAHGDQRSPAAMVDTTVLGELVTTTLEGVHRLRSPLAELTHSLENVAGKLDEDVAAARAAQAAAESEAAEARGQSEAAERARGEAESERDAAEQARKEAEQARERAEQAKHAAEHAQSRAEGQRDRYAAHAQDLEQRLAAVTQLRDEAEQNLAETRAELRSTQQTLADTREQLDTATARVHQLVGEHTAALEQARREHSEELERLRTEHADQTRQLEQRHQGELDELRRSHAEEQRRTREELQHHHATQVADLHETIGGLRHQLSVAEQHRDDHARLLTHWTSTLSRALHEDTDEQALTEVIRRLLHEREGGTSVEPPADTDAPE
ncbi:hypothetical protein [Actinopolyspora mortivallis]|uniref:Response regulator receiver protein n=1 Tax=Actinopolyspora mortivallis TaxID=33906 RepID=A0A2T0GVF7_ACTMO|nr:hypothetical protein [Actinopolyspora mortivallis]PRW63077.1 hypothetical protein CEP50_12325 [Actinopolyspora mortivallis]